MLLIKMRKCFLIDETEPTGTPCYMRGTDTATTECRNIFHKKKCMRFFQRQSNTIG